MIYIQKLKYLRCKTLLKSVDDKDTSGLGDKEKFYDELFERFRVEAEEELGRPLTRDEEIYFRYDINANLKKYDFLLEDEDEDEFYDAESESGDDRSDDDDLDFAIGTAPDVDVKAGVTWADSTLLIAKDKLKIKMADDLSRGSDDTSINLDDYLRSRAPDDPFNPLNPMNILAAPGVKPIDMINLDDPPVTTVGMAFVPYAPMTPPPKRPTERSDILLPYRMENSWIYSGCYYDQTLLDEPFKYTQLGLLTEDELENLREYVTVRRYRTFNEAKSQGIMNSVYLTLIPCNPARTMPPFNDSYKTSLPYAHRLSFEYVRTVIKGWTWSFEMKGETYHYKVAPDSVSEKNTRKSRKR